MRSILLAATVLTCAVSTVPARADALLYQFTGVQLSSQPEPSNLPQPTSSTGSLSFIVESAGPYTSANGLQTFNTPSTEQTFNGVTELQAPTFLEDDTPNGDTHLLRTTVDGRFLTLPFTTKLFSGTADSGYTLLPGTYTLQHNEYEAPFFFVSGTLVVTDIPSPPINSAVPEPSTLTLLGTGAFGMAGLVRRKLLRH